MKRIFSILLISILFIGCGNLSVLTPYGKIDNETDSQIFVYTDADVLVKDGIIRSDDTTLIVIGVNKEVGNIDNIFDKAMQRLKEIFNARKEVYKAWIIK